MRRFFLILSGVAVILALSIFPLAAQETTAIQSSEAVDELDLQAVSELFKESETLEDFEKALNDPETGINNLDLNEDGQVDFIRVVEETEGETHLIILQAALGEDDFQDVATITVDKSSDDSYNMQVQGNEDLYGENYYIAPANVRVHTWPIVIRFYRPGYRPYRSRYVWGVYPAWWRPYRPVKVTVYRTRVVRYRRGPTFVVTRKPRVVTVRKVHYQPRRSVVVKRRNVTVTRTRRRR